MPRENPVYRDTLEGLRIKANERYPGKFTFKAPQVADIVGISRRTVYDRKYIPPGGGYTTLEALARKIANDVS